MLEIVHAHGLEGSPRGVKATYLRERLGAVAPWLGELDLDGQVEALRGAIGEESSAVAIGSSLGALAALGLADRFPELVGRLILLAPAVGGHRLAADHPEVEAQRPGLVEQWERYSGLSVPEGIPCEIIHGLHDDLIRLDDVLDLVRRSPTASLLLVHDDHALTASRDLILATAARAAG
ncbi:MAG: hypothetical protein R6V85_16405 [Polyangia bacterium]